MTLTAATVLLIGLCYVVAAPTRPASNRSHATAAALRADEADLQRQCRRVADQLKKTAPQRWSVVLRPPFVIAGDIPVDELEELYLATVVPVVHALQVDYFDREPRTPISLLVLSCDDAFREALERAGHGQQPEYSGLYVRSDRTVLVNLSAGAGTLTHELTHALAHADCPDLPEWLDEGLASLHEEADFGPDGLHLIGRDNWRIRFVQEADRRGCLEPLDQLLSRPFARRTSAALDYALARYLCLFLQERGLLPAYYRKCRSLITVDPTGRLALERLFSGRSIDDVDREFREWLRLRT